MSTLVERISPTSMYPREDIRWGFVNYFSFVHGVGIVGVLYALFAARWNILVAAVAYFYLCHLSITMFAHRLYAHSSYWASAPLQWVGNIQFCGTAQGPMIWWQGKHIVHHQREDGPQDPHSPLRFTDWLQGFLHAHMYWMLTKSGSAAPDARYMLHMANARYNYSSAFWCSKHYVPLMVLMTYLVPTGIGYLLGDWVGGLLVIGFARLVAQYHLTWVVNSVCHMWGEKGTVSKTARNLRPILAIFTVGESNHATHHDNPKGYRFGDKWHHFDIGGWVIDLCMYVGLARPLEKR